ncbi:hypothetical protein DM860_008320 [Cuscuta australis]|uniref:Nuclear matrix constituent protein 1-like protein n=1 Tax=Cuscuta australis TaxID=267555 RepID=A0A328D4X5_9ASTE|nr:hypothetical protein DM860_008320 [Cuscuta australis]
MFTPQRKSWPALSINPPVETGGPPRTPNPPTTGKGKAVAFIDGPPPPPPVALLSDNVVMGVRDSESADDWRRLREAGLLDEASMERQDRKALIEKTERLERELFDYQYNMGLLLIEKKEWMSRFDELEDELAEAREILKREKTAHVIAIGEVEKREEKLRNALGYEKQCVTDLERALRETQAEYEQLKLASEIKLADASALKAGIQDQSIEVREKLHMADAKLAESNRKNLELDMKLHELEARESVLKRERLSFDTEREAHEITFFKHKEDLRQWEIKLQEREEKLCDGRRFLNDREEKMNELDRILKQKEKNLEEEQKKLDIAKSSLEERDLDVKSRLEKTIANEQDADNLKKNMEMKENELNALAERLSRREKVEIQKLVDQQRERLDADLQKFEMELEEKRKRLDEELKTKRDDWERKETELSHLEGKIKKQEQALDKKSERVKEREKDIDSKSKSLKEKEKSIMSEENRLEMMKKEISSDKDSLLALKDKIDKLKSDLNEKEVQICEEAEKLRITEADRAEHLRLQAELKQAIEKCRIEQEMLLKQSEELKEDKKKFEEEWELLDEKRAAVLKDLDNIREEKAMLERIQHDTEEQIRNKKTATEEYIKRELEAIKTEKESFAAMMKQERLMLSEKADNDYNQLLHGFEARRLDLETDVRNKQEEMERTFQEKKRAFDEERERELSQLHSLKDAAKKELEEVSFERLRLEKEKQEVSANRKKLEEHQLEIRRDIDDLAILSKKLKGQREHFVKERCQFLTLVERIKNCNQCRETAHNFTFSEVNLMEMENSEASLSALGDEILQKVASFVEKSPIAAEQKLSDSGGRVSWLRKCTTKFFKLSPNKTIQNLESTSYAAEENRWHDSSIDVDIRDSEGPGSTHADDIYKKRDDVPEESQQSGLSIRHTRGKKPNGGIRRTRSVKEVVEDAKVILGNTSESMQPDDNHSRDLVEVSRANSSTATTRRKRTRGQGSKLSSAEPDVDESEGHSESVTTGGRRKRRQTTAPSGVHNNSLGTRYNLRNRNPGTTAGKGKTGVDEQNNGNLEVIAETTDAPSTRAPEIAEQNGHQTTSVQLNNSKVIERRTIFSSGAPKTKTPEDEESLPLEFNEEDNSTLTPEGEENDSDEESDDRGQASIGKKLWTFFTS